MKALLFDFSRTLLFPKNPHDSRDLNDQHQEFRHQQGYQLFDYFELNQEMLDFVHQIKDRLPSYIFTSGSMIGGAPDLQAHLTDFVKIYSGADLGLDKQTPEAYTAVAEDIGLPPEEILFIDDSMSNIVAAEKAGMQTVLYTSNEEVMRWIRM